MVRKKAAERAEASPTTRERLLETAVDVFGRYGYEAATTRHIAREAGVNIAAIAYHFNGKEGLYRAVVTELVGLIDARVVTTIRELSLPEQGGGPDGEDPLDRLERLIVRLVDFMVGSPQALRAARLILREQLFPTPAYDIIFNGFLAPVLDGIATLVGAATGETSRRTAMLRATAIIGQILAFRIGRETVVRALGLTGYSRDETEEIRQLIIEHTRKTLSGLKKP